MPAAGIKRSQLQSPSTLHPSLRTVATVVRATTSAPPKRHTSATPAAVASAAEDRPNRSAMSNHTPTDGEGSMTGSMSVIDAPIYFSKSDEAIFSTFYAMSKDQSDSYKVATNFCAGKVINLSSPCLETAQFGIRCRLPSGHW